MFQSPKYVQNSFNINFPRQPLIRRLANEFEDKLKGQYFQPQIIPVPDDLDPEIPRIIFGSLHGYSQILISQISISFNVKYSLDWQLDISKGKEYILERITALFELLEILNVKPNFCGIATIVQIPCTEEDDQILHHLANIFLKNGENSNHHDIEIKITTVQDHQFYSNITVRNYRTWKILEQQSAVQRLPRSKAFERGIQILGDFNDRYAFNENSEYFSHKNIAEQIVLNGLEQIEGVIVKVRG